MGAPFIFVIGAWIAMAPVIYAVEAVALGFIVLVNGIKKIFGIEEPAVEETTTEAIL